MDIIYYHGHCPDGWTAAYVASKKYPEAALVPLNYSEFDPALLIEEARDKDVLMVDFSLKTLELNVALANNAKSLLVLDHHKTSVIGQMANSTTAKFVLDVSRSGAGLAWDYLFGKDSDYWNPADPFREGLRPWWVNYVEDQDLWLWALPDSREINAYLNVQTRTVKAWDDMLKFLSIGDTEDSIEQVVRLGGAITQFEAYMVAGAMREVQQGYWYEHTVGVVNHGYVGQSQVGEAIYNAGYDIALIWHEDKRGKIRFGLRSKTVDVGALAATFEGGGGHKEAAGFELPRHLGYHLIDALLKRDNYVNFGRR